MKKIGIFIFLLYAPSITCIFRIVQDSTLDALQIYENLDDISDEKEVFLADQEVEEEKEEAAFSDQISILEQDPEQYFVDKKDVQERINVHEILEYTLDEVLDRAREYPGYYGDSDEEEITEWYHEAQDNAGYQKEILDHIKDDSKKHSLEKLLEHAQNHALYKGLLSYQKIVDIYYQINPEKIYAAEQSFNKAVKFLYIDDYDNDEMYEKDLQKFLMEYKKLPTSLQNIIMIETFHGVPYISGKRIKNAKNLADWIIDHKSDYLDCKKIIALITT